MKDDQELTVDARGLACPTPVLRAKQALDGIEAGRVVVLVDEHVARENVTRLAAHLGCSQRCEEVKGTYRITIDKPAGPGGRP